jgi:hypothetical protein
MTIEKERKRETERQRGGREETKLILRAHLLSDPNPVTYLTKKAKKEAWR